MGNSRDYLGRLILIISTIILSITPGYLSAQVNAGMAINLNSGTMIQTAFSVDLTNIDITQITSYDSMINQMNLYLGFLTDDIRIQSVSLVNSFISSTNAHETVQYTGANLSCDIAIDKTILKSNKCGILTITINIKKFPSTVCGTNDCQTKYIADIKTMIRSRYISVIMLILQTANGGIRLVSAQFCYFVNSLTLTYNQANKCLCTIGNNLTPNNNPTSGTQNFLTTFGYGTDQYSNKTPADFGFTSEHTQVFSDCPGDGYFAIANVVPACFFWIPGGLDHTANETGGYMYVLNALLYPGLYFNKTINNLSIGKMYEFSTYAANLNQPGWSPSNIIFQVRTATSDNTLITEGNSGNIPDSASFTWNKYGISFVAPSTSVMLLMISNGTSSAGNDVALDDIGLCGC
ncbi:unnamed protein product [Adineta steineri]|uniref:Uncharacterized protein n=2 Tax=Adineta steineri TaxID=433720 RepID=A0A815WRC6_9BILA|nr:unnamed protein product [Adineta steineri]CAF1548680.1 unnamed protein product [Adineta steineri]